MNISIIIIAIIGLYITYRISREKKQKLAGQKMVCFVGQDCEKVVFSEYSRFFGMNLEMMGFAYYLLIAIVYTASTIFPTLINDLVNFIILGMTFGGLLFSAYLTAIQIVKLKSYCTWCISSAITSTAIFVLAFIKNVMVENKIFEYVNDFSQIVLATEFVTSILTFSIALYLALRKNISHKNILFVRQANWLAIFLFVLSNVQNPTVFNTVERLTIILIIINFIYLKWSTHLIILSTKNTLG